MTSHQFWLIWSKLVWTISHANKYNWIINFNFLSYVGVTAVWYITDLGVCQDEFSDKLLTKIVLPENAEHNDGWNERTDAEHV